MIKKESAINQLEDIILHASRLKRQFEMETGSNPSDDEIQKYITLCYSAIIRLSSSGSVYVRQIDEIVNEKSNNNYKRFFGSLGIVSALLYDIENDYLESIAESIRAEVYVDYVEMAEDLLENNYKDAAAVILGSVIEEKIRTLCTKNGINIMNDNEGVLKPKSIETLNQELYKNEVYIKTDMKAITTWMSLRNSAAHGKYDEVDKNQVQIMKMYINDFLNRVK